MSSSCSMNASSSASNTTLNVSEPEISEAEGAKLLLPALRVMYLDNLVQDKEWLSNRLMYATKKMASLDRDDRIGGLAMNALCKEAIAIHKQQAASQNNSMSSNSSSSASSSSSKETAKK